MSDGPSVCLCPSVSRGLRECDSLCFLAVCVCLLVSYIVCELPSLSAQCALETVVVLCRLGLHCPILSWFVLCGSVCVSPVCVVSLLCLLFLSFSFVRLSFGYSVRSFFALFFHSSKASHVPVFSHANANEAQQLTFEKFITAAPPVLSKEHTARTRDPQVCSGMTPAKPPSDDTILRSFSTPCRVLLASLSVAMMHQIVQNHSKR